MMDKRFLVVGLVIVSLCANVFAFAFVGPPTAELKKGQLSVGFNYSYSNQDDSKVKNEWYAIEVPVDDPTTPDHGTTKVHSRDIKTQLYYGNIGYGIDDWWQVYVQLGAADVKKDNMDERWGDWWSLNFDNGFAWGWGTKITFAKQDKIDWGASLQMNWLDASWTGKWESEGDETYADHWQDSAEIDTYDLLIAVGPTIDMGGWKLYGGPFYYYLSGDIDNETRGLSTWDGGSGGWFEKGHSDAEADNNFGGYIGAQVDIAQNSSAAVEFGSNGDVWSLGAGIAWKF
jgi:hypothetical protein